MSTAVQMASWPDIENLETAPGLNVEVIGGEIVLSPRPAPAGNLSQTFISSVITFPFGLGRDGPGGWWILIEPEVEFAEHEIYIPDVAGWRRTTLPTLPDSRPMRVRPDWVCEVLSPSTSRHDRRGKARTYLKSGVPNYWLLDPKARTLEAWENGGERWSVFGVFSDGDVVRIPPFDAVELDVGRLFLPL